MESPESSTTGVLIACGVIVFLSACLMIRVLHALEELDKKDKNIKYRDEDGEF